MSGDEFMERFSWHVADKGFRMVRYYGFLSPVKRRLLEDVVYVITETVRKTAMQIRWRGMYQRLLKVDPLKCILCGCQMRFTGLKRGYRLTELVLMHEPLAQQRVCGWEPHRGSCVHFQGNGVKNHQWYTVSLDKIHLIDGGALMARRQCWINIRFWVFF